MPKSKTAKRLTLTTCVTQEQNDWIMERKIDGETTSQVISRLLRKLMNNYDKDFDNYEESYKDDSKQYSLTELPF